VGVFHWGGVPFMGPGEGRRGGEGEVTANDAVAFNGRGISGSSWRVEARFEGGVIAKG
jgi:hypothetical protein